MVSWRVSDSMKMLKPTCVGSTLWVVKYIMYVVLFVIYGKDILSVAIMKDLKLKARTEKTFPFESDKLEFKSPFFSH